MACRSRVRMRARFISAPSVANLSTSARVARPTGALLLLIALVTAVAMKVVGVLLVTSLLVIPAATARHFARTPEQMVVIAALVGMLAVAGGLAGSLGLDTPTGPSIVVVATLLFALGLLHIPRDEAPVSR